jgi:hypothetical protein
MVSKGDLRQWSYNKDEQLDQWQTDPILEIINLYSQLTPKNAQHAHDLF